MFNWLLWKIRKKYIAANKDIDTFRGIASFMHMCTWAIGRFFKDFQVYVKAICSFVTWPCMVQICSCLSHCYSASFLNKKYNTLSCGVRYIRNIFEVFQWFCCKLIVMVNPRTSPGTHLLKNYESQSRTNESQFEKHSVLNWKCFSPK